MQLSWLARLVYKQSPMEIEPAITLLFVLYISTQKFPQKKTIRSVIKSVLQLQKVKINNFSRGERISFELNNL